MAEGAGEEKVEAQGWYTSLPTDLQEHPSMQKLKMGSVEDVVRSNIEAQKMVGSDKIALPGKDADPTEWSKFYETLGRPKESKDYAIDITKAPEGVTMDQGRVDRFKAAAHAAGLVPSQVEGVMKFYLGEMGADAKAIQDSQKESYDQTSTALRRDWGAAYDEKVGNVRKLLGRFATPEEAEEVNNKYGNDPVMLRILANVSSKLSEDVLSQEGISNLGMTPAQATEELHKIMSDTKGALFDGQHPDHKRMVDRTLVLREAISKGKG